MHIRTRRILAVVLGLLIILIPGAYFLGLLMPEAHVAVSRVTLQQPRDTVWRVVRNMGAHPQWWPDVVTMERESEDPEVWLRVDARGDRMPIRVMLDIPPTQIITEILDEGLPFGGTWAHDVVPRGNGETVVTITEEGHIYQPFYRVVSKVFGYHANMDSFLVALGRHFGEDVTPVHLD